MSSETPVQELASPREDQSFHDKYIEKWINRNFIFSIIGGLQMAVVILGMLTICLLGSAVSHSHPNTSAYWHIGGYSYYAFLFIVGFWCFMTSIIVYFTSATSENTAATLPKTTFYVAYHITASCFYLFATMALLVETAKFDYISVKVNDSKASDVKGLVFGGGSFGAIVCALYIVLSVFGVRRFRQR